MSFSASRRIPFADLSFAPPRASGVEVRPLLPGAVPGVAIDGVSLAGPAKHLEIADHDCAIVWLFLGGEAVFSVRGENFPVHEEAIGHAPVGWPAEIEVAAGRRLLAVRIRKRLDARDRAELERRAPADCRPYVSRFADCPAYTEAIKSPRTVSRTVLPPTVIPRMAAGTVYTTGPDQVAPHRHPMLEQMFVGLKDNHGTVTADDARTVFPPLSILHIPLGSMHGAQVEADHTLHYIWIDYFGTADDQAWLDTHKPL